MPLPLVELLCFWVRDASECVVVACCGRRHRAPAGNPDWEHSGRGEGEGFEVDLGHAPVERDRLVRERQR